MLLLIKKFINKFLEFLSRIHLGVIIFLVTYSIFWGYYIFNYVSVIQGISVTNYILLETDEFYSIWEPLLVPFSKFLLFNNPLLKWIIVAILVLAFIIVATFMAAHCLFLYFDTICRRSSTQIPYNWLIDRMIPIMFLILPSFYILIMHPLAKWHYNFGLLILIHLLIVIPMFHYWSNLRAWENSRAGLKSWNNPMLYKHIAIAILFPAIWGVYFSFVRYLRLGEAVDFSFLFTYSDWLFITIFLCIFYSIWVRLLIWKLLDLKLYLWDECLMLIHSIHIQLLQKKIYFKFMEWLYKISILWLIFRKRFCTIYPKVTLSGKLIRLADRFYFIFSILVFLCVLLDLLLNNFHVVYSSYLLFAFPILYFVLNFFNKLASYPWADAVCASDYLYKNFKSPHYPTRFWHNFNDDTFRFGFSFEFDEYEWAEIQKLSEPYLRRQPMSFSYDNKLTMRVYFLPRSIRVKAFYFTWSNVRWMHTETGTRVFHKVTPYFARSVWDRIALLNNSWSHYSTILKIDSLPKIRPNISYLGGCYGNFTFNKPTNFAKFVEQNTVTNFYTLTNKGVQISTYQNQVVAYKTQENPDLVFDFSKQTWFMEKRVLGLDMKSIRSPGIGNHKILSEISIMRYNTTLEYFKREIFKVCPSSISIKVEISNALDLLSLSSDNCSVHQLIWANNIHLFPNDFIPPLRVPRNFAIEDLTPECLEKIQIAKLRMTKISDYLYFKKIPPTVKGEIPQEAEDLLNDSFIQQIYKDHPL